MTEALQSMTGYGSGTAKVPGGLVSVEVRSVNQRFLDVNLKGPREYVALERELGALVRARLRRGKVDIFINKSVDGEDPGAVRVDADLARSYHASLVELAEALKIDSLPSIEFLAAQRGVLVVGAFTPDSEADGQGVSEATEMALDALVQMRTEEGKRLAEDLLDNTRKLAELTTALEERSPQMVEEFRAGLTERLEKLLGDTKLDEQRLAQEVAVLAERVDIHEEIVRLRSHIDQFEKYVREGGQVGRRLDFLLQEVLREINTSGSKASDAQAAGTVVDMKAVAERLREQAQNVE